MVSRFLVRDIYSKIDIRKLRKMASGVLEKYRKLSKVEFLTKARKIMVDTNARAKRFPKRQRTLSNRMFDASIKIYDECLKANQVYLKDEESLRKREEHFTNALGGCTRLMGLIDLALEIGLCKKFTEYQMAHWLGALWGEINLINGVIESDRKRIKQS